MIGQAFRSQAGPIDRLDAMQVLLVAVECGSLSKASRRLGQPLATVSRKVKDLESQLKADLLVRSPKSVFEKARSAHGHRLTSVAQAAMMMRVSATAVSCS